MELRKLPPTERGARPDAARGRALATNVFARRPRDLDTTRPCGAPGRPSPREIHDATGPARKAADVFSWSLLLVEGADGVDVDADPDTRVERLEQRAVAAA